MGKENKNNRNGQLLLAVQAPPTPINSDISSLNCSQSICRRALTLRFSPPRSLKNSYTRGTFKPPTYRQLPYFITQPKPEGSGCRLYLILTHAVPALCDFDFLSPKPEKERKKEWKKNPSFEETLFMLSHTNTKRCTRSLAHTDTHN